MPPCGPRRIWLRVLTIFSAIAPPAVAARVQSGLKRNVAAPARLLGLGAVVLVVGRRPAVAAGRGRGAAPGRRPRGALTAVLARVEQLHLLDDDLVLRPLLTV